LIFDFFDLIDFVYFYKVFLDCTGMRVCQHFVVIGVTARRSSEFGVHFPLESGWKDSVFFSTRFLEIHGDEPSCWKFVSTSLDIVVQGRHAFKFKLGFQNNFYR